METIEYCLFTIFGGYAIRSIAFPAFNFDVDVIQVKRRVTMKEILVVFVFCCWHLIQGYGYYKTGVIRESCLENELESAVINSVSTGSIYILCIPSPPFTKKCSYQDITVRGWRCPGNSFPDGRVRCYPKEVEDITLGSRCTANSPFPTGRMRCCTKKGLEIKKCIVDPNIITFDKDFVLVPPKGFHLKGRRGVGNPNDPIGYRIEFCSLRPQRLQH
ncbi:uncharacterized protein LOC134266475 [Saccostrea cucullata]|uniref:uncharacterized protein LOC134266475 n=1 Tax=Saccostrea cuccullata TaxID=36930 RepID=UPI002ED088AF